MMRLPEKPVNGPTEVTADAIFAKLQETPEGRAQLEIAQLKAVIDVLRSQ